MLIIGLGVHVLHYFLAEMWKRQLKGRGGSKKKWFVVGPEWIGKPSLSISCLCNFESCTLQSHLSQVRAIQRSCVLRNLNILLASGFSVRSSVSCFMPPQWLWQFVSPEKPHLLIIGLAAVLQVVGFLCLLCAFSNFQPGPSFKINRYWKCLVFLQDTYFSKNISVVFTSHKESWDTEPIIGNGFMLFYALCLQI